MQVYRRSPVERGWETFGGLDLPLGGKYKRSRPWCRRRSPLPAIPAPTHLAAGLSRCLDEGFDDAEELALAMKKRKSFLLR